jgi:predicted deacylase
MQTYSSLPLEGLKAGTAIKGYLRLSVGVEVELPFAVIQGHQPGPRLLLTAGIHGAEYASIAAAGRWMALDPGQLVGSLVVLPVVNPLAFDNRSIYNNPLDGLNLNRVFPGKADGSYAYRLAHWLTQEAIRGSAAYIDLHGGDLIEALVPFTLFPAGDPASQQLAEVFGIPRLLSTGPVGTTMAAAQQMGVPAILAEAGGNGLWPQPAVDLLEEGVRRVMVHLGMLPGQLESRPTHLVSQFAWLRSDHRGWWYPAVEVGDQVKEGQLLGRITDPFGTVLQEAYSSVNGEVLFLVTSLAIHPGDPLCGIGVG